MFLEQEGKCALTGDKLYFKSSRLDRIDSKEQTASLDRIDSSKGYIEGNVQWVHKKINLIKMDLSQEEFIEMCKKVSNKYNGNNIC